MGFRIKYLELNSFADSLWKTATRVWYLIQINKVHMKKEHVLGCNRKFLPWCHHLRYHHGAPHSMFSIIFNPCKRAKRHLAILLTLILYSQSVAQLFILVLEGQCRGWDHDFGALRCCHNSLITWCSISHIRHSSLEFLDECRWFVVV